LLSATLRLGAVHLTVSNLDRSVAFYEDVIGLWLHSRAGAVASMGAGGEDLIVVHEEAGARRAERHAGLYHYALLHPSREELAHAALRLAATKTPIQGASDHGTHEAIYLPDPDGNGIELAADRPREACPQPLDYTGGPQPLDLDGLLCAIAGERL
jgi:catechol 2,3-dioxygenase